MISLNIQFKLIVFSFIFGFLISILFELFNNILKKSSQFVKNINSLIIIVLLSFIYIFSIHKICNTIFHVYSIIFIILGFSFYDVILSIIAKQNKK